MNELNAEQIIKALECCAVDHECGGCPCQTMPTIANCVLFSMRNALALIKELTEDRDGFESLAYTAIESQNRMSDTIEELTEENERLRAEKEGKWLMCGIFDDLAKCSACGYSEHSLMEVYGKPFYFCPNCGAKMEGECMTFAFIGRKENKQ